MNHGNKWLEALEKKDYAVFLVLTLLCLVLKIQWLTSASVWRLDEFCYIQGARAMAGGGILYRDFGDVKPPGIFFLFYALIRLLGYDGILFSAKITTLIFQVLSAFYLFKTVEILFDRKKAFLVAILLVWAMNVSYRLWPTNIMLLVLLPMILAIYFLVKDRWNFSLTNILWSGFFSGTAVLISSNMIFYALLYPAVAFYGTRSLRRGTSITLTAALGFLIPVGLFITYLLIHGAIADWYWWNVTWAGIYGGSLSLPRRIYTMLLTFGRLWEWLPVYVLAVIGLFKLFAKGRFLKDRAAYFIFTLIIVSLLSRIVLSKGMPRYFLYLLPAFILTAMLVDFNRIGVWMKAVMGLFFIFSILINNYWALSNSYDAEFERREPVVEWIKSHTGASDKIYVWHEGYEIYFASKRNMATSYFSPSQHLDVPILWERGHYKNFQIVWDKFIAEFERDRPELIIDITDGFQQVDGEARGEKLQMNIDRFLEVVRTKYFLAAEINGVSIWEKKY